MWQFASITSWALWFFEHIDISKGSVVTYLRCGGIFKYGLLQIYHWVCQWKNFESQLTLGEAVGKSLVSCFFGLQCISGDADKWWCSTRNNHVWIESILALFADCHLLVYSIEFLSPGT